MSGLFDLIFSYVMVGAGFVVFGTLAHAWVYPDRLGGASLTGLMAASFVLGLLGAVLIVVGLNWHRAAIGSRSLPGAREL